MNHPSVDWQNRKYRECFEEELRGLERRLEADKSCTAAELEGTLKNLYIMEGAGWGGRGEAQDISLGAAIAAHEEILSRLKSNSL